MSANPAELGVIKVASPCHRDWEKMTGDQQSRFCSDCKLNVYNLSAMTTDEARDLIRAKEGQLCVRFFQRADGTVITKNCPVGIAKVRRRWLVAGATAASVAAAGFATFVANSFAEAEPPESCGQLAPIPHPDETAGAQVLPATPPPGQTPQEATDWIERRRSQLGPREKDPNRYPVMGRMQIIRIRDDKKTD